MYNVNAGGDIIKIDIVNHIEEFEFAYSFNDEELEKSGLISLDDLVVKGYIQKKIDNFYLSLSLSGTMVLSCSITLEPVDHQFNVEIEGYIDELTENIEQNDIKVGNSIDIFPIVWENVLVEIPMKVTSSNIPEEIDGEGWKLIKEKEKPENEFSKLKDLF